MSGTASGGSLLSFLQHELQVVLGELRKKCPNVRVVCTTLCASNLMDRRSKSCRAS